MLQLMYNVYSTLYIPHGTNSGTGTYMYTGKAFNYMQCDAVWLCRDLP